MLKLLGAILVVLAGTLIGFYQAARYANRPRQIRQLIQALQRLETEIGYGFTPLPDALLRISRQLAEPLASLFGKAAEQLEGDVRLTAQESWQRAVEEIWPKTAMNETERDAVRQLGFSLGISDRADQSKHLRLAMSQLQAEEQTARDEQSRYEKMWKSLGVLAGALIVILMY